MKFKIDNIGYYLPKKVENIQTLKKENPKWDVEKIIEKTGINKRFISKKNESTTSMALEAVNNIKNFSSKKNEIDFLLFVTQTPEYVLPTSACILQNKLGLQISSMCFDINLGCSGFIYALAISGSLINSSICKKGLIICSEKYSSYIDKDNRTCRPVFSDGAAAVIVGKDERDNIGPFDIGTDGSGYDKLIVTKQNFFDSENKIKFKKNKIHMNGADVFTFTLSKVPLSIKNLLKKAEKNIEDIDLFIFHQASKFVLDKLAKNLNIPKNRIFINYNEIGNSVSATIPIALYEAKKRHILKNNSLILLSGFGVGYSWGSCLVRWNDI